MAGSRACIAEYDATSSKGRYPDAALLEEVVRLERRIFPKHESLARSLEQELRKKNGGLIYLAEMLPGEGGGGGRRRGELIGYVMYAWVSSLCASITKLAVKEHWRRQGHGEALLKAAIEKCRTRNIQRVFLHVDPVRTAAVSLYEKFGFQVEELIEGYYSPERHAYRMYLDFDDLKI